MRPVSVHIPVQIRLALLGTVAVVATAVLAPAHAAAPAAAVPAAAVPAAAGPAAAGPAAAAPDAAAAWAQTAYRGHIQVTRGYDSTPSVIDGYVFVDANRNSAQDAGEVGLAGVVVSNGRDVVKTDKNGRYELPIYNNMTVSVTQPSGYQVPVDADNVAQFSYHHLPAGSPKLKYGGIAPTGPLPDDINFPLVRSAVTGAAAQHCAIGGDVQTYNTKEIGYARAGAFTDLSKRTDYEGCGALFLGDVVGDDLSLYSQTRTLTRMLNGPARFLPGNHDLDYDATVSEHAYDTFRAKLGPEYYSYDVGKAHIVALSDVEYPLVAGKKWYNGSLDARQLQWLRNDIAMVPTDKVIILASHIPLLSFADADNAANQVKQVKEIYNLLRNRKVVAIGGHTHTIENIRAGDSLAGWKDVMGVDAVPFPQLIAGAISGDWYLGRVLPAGYPTALQYDGAHPGVLTLDINGTSVIDRFTVRGRANSFQMALGLNTPAYRTWYVQSLPNKGHATPLANPLVVPRSALSTTWLTTNFFNGGTGSTVSVWIDGGLGHYAQRTQPMRGEAVRFGTQWSDPVAVQEQMVHGGSIADRSMHLWRLRLPTTLAVGQHTAKVKAVDVHGREYFQSLTFTVK